MTMFSEELFRVKQFNSTNNPDFDFLCFTGGEDVSPELYGQRPHPTTGCNYARDKYEREIFEEYPDIPKIGICRGSQFLNVMCGGTLWQNVNNHGRSHYLFDARTGEKVLVTSTHHQMMVPTKGAQLLAYAQESTRRETDLLIDTTPDHFDVESVFYPKYNTFCYQPHPEYDMQSCRDYFFKLLKEIF
jgi:gamma-glutamyl-gamma-aminobutyrate hydrolase PuuD